MRNWKTSLIVVLLAVGLIVGGSALYIRSQVKQTLDDLTRAAALVADVRYGGVNVSPGGTIRVSAIEIEPRATPGVLTIDLIEIETPGLWFLMTGRKAVEQGKIPEVMQFHLHGFTMDTGGSLARELDKATAAALEQSGRPPMTNCGDIEQVDFAALRKIGYEKLVTDLSFGYRLQRDRTLGVNILWRGRDFGALESKIEFNNVAPNVREAITSAPVLRMFDVSYKDLAYVERVKQYCAKASASTVEQYIDSEVNRADVLYQADWGFVPGPGLREAWREFLTKPGEIRVKGYPGADINWAGLNLYKVEDVVSMLALNVKVNGREVSDLSVSEVSLDGLAQQIQAAAAAETQGDSAPATAAAPTTTPVNAEPSTESGTAGYRRVAVKDLSRHVGRKVRLTLTRGAVREGELLQMRDNLARVERRYSGGSTTIAIPLNEISGAEVLE